MRFLSLSLVLLLCVAASARIDDSEIPFLSDLGAPQFGDWCDESEDCVFEDPNLECINKRCSCRRGFLHADGYCRRDISASLPRLGNWCEENADCADVGPHMVCSRAVCQCEEGYILVEDMCKAWSRPVEVVTTQRTPQPGDECEEDRHCSLIDANLECQERECRCKQGYAPLDGKCNVSTISVTLATPTIRPSRLGDWCIVEEDCSAADGNLECFGGVCLCKQGFVPEDGICTKESPPTTTSTTSTTPRARPAKAPLIGDWCVDGQDCARTDENMECFSEVCLCKNGYEHREGMCKKEIQGIGPLWSWTWEKASTLLVGAPCEDTGDCPSDEQMECIRGFCQCIVGHVERAGACRRKIARIGGICYEDKEVCYLEDDDGDEKTACVGGKCACKEGFVFADEKCKQYIKNLGARCDPDVHICFLEGDGEDPKVECRDGKCQCKDSYEEIDGNCANVTSSKELGASCQNDASCKNILNARCNAEKCSCKEGYGPMNSKTCGKRIGDRCDDGVCDALNTQCTKRQRGTTVVQVCACKKFYLSSSNRTYCYTWPQNVGDLCEQTQNCMFLGDNIQCKDGRCQCEEAFALEDGVCVDNTTG